ncbi:MAG: metallophosphoesterase [Alphaproteobacteria bacterium]|nr:metallophosphoesterase [Alphaproteobacteria bacterium]
MLTYAVLADSHFHAADADAAQLGYPSDASFNARNAAAVALVRRVRPAFAVHLGDLSHPVPGLRAHDVAMAEAQRTLAGLGCPLLVVPGNHDIGDKPHAWAPAPGVTSARHDAFAARWNAPFWVRDHGPLRLVGIDTPVLNSGLPEEAAQWAFLEQALETDRRVHAFLHYPPFLLHPDEGEHYDNLAEPARSRLLGLLARADAAFCGHVHHPFWHRHGATDWYLLPGLAFVRPGFAELAPLAAADEHGRNDVGRLGLCLVHVADDGGHRVEWVRTEGATTARTWAPGLGPGQGAPRCPLHLTLRHAWDQVHSVPADNLDPYRRKDARSDLALLAAWQLGPSVLRLPLSDLHRPATRQRMVDLHAHGLSFVLFAAALPGPDDLALLDRHRDLVLALELVLPPHLLSAAPSLPVPLWRSLHHKARTADGVYFSHFPADGFPLDVPLPDEGGVVVRVPPDADVWDAVSAAAERLGDRAVCRVWLPRAGEGTAAVDDAAVVRIVAQAFLAARAWPDVRVGLETFVDHDRGYFPRHGLIDRRGDPRPAWWSLLHLARGIPSGAAVVRRDVTCWDVGGVGRVRLDPVDLPDGAVDLATGDAARPGAVLILER